MVDKKQKPTIEMVEYLLAAEVEAEAKAKKEGLRPIVLEQFKEHGNKFTGIGYSIAKSYPIDEIEFYNWVRDNWPNLVSVLCKDLIDPEKFERAVAMRLIDYDHLPDNIYTYKENERISRKKI